MIKIALVNGFKTPDLHDWIRVMGKRFDPADKRMTVT